MVNGFTSLRDPRVCVRVLEGGRARTAHEFPRAERFIFAKIAVDLPSAQTAAGIHDFPPVAAENLLHLWRLSQHNCPVAQAALIRFDRRRITRDQNAAASGRL